MVNTIIYIKDNNYIGFKTSGHANYEYGEEYDIVCSAVSILTQTFYFHIVENLDYEEEDIEEEQLDGYLKIMIKNKIDNKLLKEAFLFMIKGLEKLEAQYSKYVKLEQMEVQ